MMAQPLKTVILTSGTVTFGLPPDWNDADNTIEVIGKGGNCGVFYNNDRGGTGGGGGAYAILRNLTANSVAWPLTFSWGAGSGDYTGVSTNWICYVRNGLNGAPGQGGIGGYEYYPAGFPGGNGGNPADSIMYRWYGGGGGGAGGPNGGGGQGGIVFSGLPGTSDGGNFINTVYYDLEWSSSDVANPNGIVHWRDEYEVGIFPSPGGAGGSEQPGQAGFPNDGQLNFFGGGAGGAGLNLNTGQGYGSYMPGGLAVVIIQWRPAAPAAANTVTFMA